MEMHKAQWLSDGDNIRVNVPIAKINEEKRLVSGFASLNNVDQHDEVVTAEASLAAFNTFRGNIREMHQPIAAGRMVSFSQETYYDSETGTPYEGIYVTAYVSKGAEDTWQKVLDGTLSGFSIGGFIIESHTEFIADLGKSIRFITGLALFELSLVDNPANQLANVLSIQKVNGEMVAKGIAAEVQTQNVFWCETDRMAKATPADTASCGACSTEMNNIGWIEVTDGSAAPAELKKFVDNWTAKVITAQQIKEETSETVQQNSEFANKENFGDNNNETAEKSEGGVDMSDVETVEKAVAVDEVVETPVEEVAETVDEVVAEEVTAEAEEVVEEAAPVEEAVAEKSVDEEVVAEEVVEKAAEEVEVSVDISELAKALSGISEALTSLAETVSEVKKNTETFAAATGKIDEVGSALENVGSRLDNLEKATATKKSGNEENSEPVHKGFSWGGHFASASSIAG